MALAYTGTGTGVSSVNAAHELDLGIPRSHDSRGTWIVSILCSMFLRPRVGEISFVVQPVRRLRRWNVHGQGH